MVVRRVASSFQNRIRVADRVLVVVSPVARTQSAWRDRPGADYLNGSDSDRPAGLGALFDPGEVEFHDFVHAVAEQVAYRLGGFPDETRESAEWRAAGFALAVLRAEELRERTRLADELVASPVLLSAIFQNVDLLPETDHRSLNALQILSLALERASPA